MVFGFEGSGEKMGILCPASLPLALARSLPQIYVALFSSFSVTSEFLIAPLLIMLIRDLLDGYARLLENYRAAKARPMYLLVYPKCDAMYFMLPKCKV